MIGVDEVGRGAWAGPLLVVAARQTASFPSGLNDSKLLTKKQREMLALGLQNCCRFGEGWVESSIIDKLGLSGALRLGVARALTALAAAFGEEIIIDGSTNYASGRYQNSRAQVKGDLFVPVISAASIYAKVTRDEHMRKLSTKHPSYGFERHVGYGTAAHKRALERYGVITGVHRVSFKPVRALAGAARA